MSTYVTDGTTTVTPQAVDGFTSARVSGIRVHPILGASNPDITYQAAGLRTGTLRLIFAAEADALTAETLHTTGSILTIVSTERAAVNFSYVAAEGDAVRVLLDDETRDVWIVEIDYQEVAA